MLVRYRMTANTTYSDMVSDVTKIINGTATALANLSANTDQTNTQFYGTYPSSNFTTANATSNVYSKVHSTVNTYTHYIKLGWDNASKTLANIQLAQNYFSGNDTLVNSTVSSVSVQPLNYTTTNVGLDIIVSPQMLYIGQGGATQLGVMDIGHNGITRVYTNSMLMIVQNMQNVINYGANQGGTIPYSYNFDTLAYGSATTTMIAQTPIRKVNATGNLTIFENPTFLTTTSGTNGYVVNVLYGVYKLPSGIYAGVQTYVDGAGLRRLTINDFSLLTY